MGLLRRVAFCAWTLLFVPLAAASAKAQQPAELPSTTPQDTAPTSTLTVKVSIVALDAIVRDRKGEQVHGLTKDNFALTEDGKPQPVRYFDEDTNLPLTIGLMVDVSGSQREYFEEQKVASATFLRSMLTNPEDNAFLVRFSDNVLLLQRMTASLPALDASLRKLDGVYPARVEPAPDGHTPGTLLFDAVCGTAHNAFPAGQQRRRAVVILTDGEDNGSTKTRDQAIECAQRADLTVYTALYTSRDPGADERDDPRVRVPARDHLMGRTIMERMSRATGGRLFVVTRQMPIERIYAAIADDLRRQYRLGYTPPPSKAGTYHELTLKTVGTPDVKHERVQTRAGYYTPE